jgi:hypothetical protein
MEVRREVQKTQQLVIQLQYIIWLDAGFVLDSILPAILDIKRRQGVQIQT